METGSKNIGGLTLTSPAFENGELIPPKYTCDSSTGETNPPLEISGVSENAKSLALIMDDPDAAAGVWVHWIVWNINPTAVGIIENSSPSARLIKKGSIPAPTPLDSAAEGVTSFGKPGYGGPCPPSGEHRYFFKLYALDTTLNLPESAGKKELEEEMKGHILQQAELMGLYKRN